jgi:hypothetical protein
MINNGVGCTGMLTSQSDTLVHLKSLASHDISTLYIDCVLSALHANILLSACMSYLR